MVDYGYEGRASASVTVVSSLREPLLVTSTVVTAVSDPDDLAFDDHLYTIFRGESMLVRAVVNEPGMGRIL